MKSITVQTSDEVLKIFKEVTKKEGEVSVSVPSQKKRFVVMTESRHDEIHAVTAAAYQFGLSVKPVTDILQFIAANKRGALTPEGVNFHCPHCDTDYFIKKSKTENQI